MTRRNLVKAASVAAVTGAAGAAAPVRKSYLELRYYMLRNGAVNQRQILTEHLSKGRNPALKRAGAGPVAAFSNTISSGGNFILTVTNYPDLASIETNATKMAADKEYQESRDAMLAKTPVPYVRIESALLRGFAWFVRGAQPLDVHKLGFSELAHSLVFGGLLAVAFLV